MNIFLELLMYYIRPDADFAFFTATNKGVSRLPSDGHAFHFANDFTFSYDIELRVLNSQLT